MSISLAEALWAAQCDGTLVKITATQKLHTEAEAYAVQADLIQRSKSDVVGWKVGGTSREIQKKLGIREPMSGALLERFSHPSPAIVPVFSAHGPHVEAEFVFRLSESLPARTEIYTPDEVKDAVDAVCPGIEIVGARIPGGLGGAGALMVIADSGVNIAFAYGAPVVEWQEIDLGRQQVRMYINAKSYGVGYGTDVLGHPLTALTWLVNWRSNLGFGLNAGDLVSTGSCTGLAPVQPGDEAMADFGPLGNVRVQFVADLPRGNK